MKEHYHSAYNPEFDYEPIERFTSESVVAFVHDVRNPFPPEFDPCDVFYCEPPWQAGFGRFNRRAKVSGGSYRDMLLTLVGFLYESEKPSVLVASPKIACEFPSQFVQLPVLLQGKAQAVAYCHGLDVDALGLRNSRTSLDVLRVLSSHYSMVGDPMCGYGLSGRVFVEAGKKAVLSDYNGRCIAAIERHFPEWSQKL